MSRLRTFRKFRIRWSSSWIKHPLTQGPVLLWLIFLGRSIFYLSVTPVWEGFDEHVHFAYVQFISENQGFLPDPGQPVSEEVFRSLQLLPLPWQPKGFGVGLTHDEYWNLDDGDRRSLEQSIRELDPSLGKIPHRGHGSHLEIYEAQHPPLYYWLLTVFYKLVRSETILARVYLLRLASVLLASVFVFPAFYLARLFFASQKTAFGVCLVIIFMPQLLIDVSRIGNDSLALTLFSLLLFCAASFGIASWKGSLVSGIVLGLGLLTKVYFLTAIPAMAMFVSVRILKGNQSFKPAAMRFLACLAVAGSISGWWYVRNYFLHGNMTGIQQSAQLRGMPALEIFSAIPRVDWPNAVDTIFFSHIWFGNWSFLTVKSWMYKVFQYIFLLAITGIALRGVKSLWQRQLSGNGGNVFFLSLFYLFFWVGLLYHVLLTYLTSGLSATPGWYLYSVVAAEMILVFHGLFCLSPPEWRRRVVGMVLSLFCLLDLYSAFFISLPYYTGFIHHNVSGGMVSFDPFRLSAADLGRILSRLSVNKPAFMSGAYVLAVVLFYLGLSVLALVYSFSLFRKEAGSTEA